VRLHTALIDDSACKNTCFKVKMISKYPYLCLLLLFCKPSFGDTFGASAGKGQETLSYTGTPFASVVTGTIDSGK
jgi:hypothetical protein